MTLNIVKKIFKRHEKDKNDNKAANPPYLPAQHLRDQLNKRKQRDGSSHGSGNGHNYTEADLLAVLSYLEGVRALKMPAGYVPHEYNFVEIPVRFAILAIELLHRGKNVPGLFRTPGNKDTIEKLHAYYDSIRVPSPSSSSTAGFFAPVKRTMHPEPNGEGPSLIPRTIHDTATVFKRYVRAVEGGILGDDAVWEALWASVPRDGNAFVAGVARALLDVRKANWRRFNFICIVFGVLAALMQEGGLGEMRDIPAREVEEEELERSWSLRSLARKISSLSLRGKKSREARELSDLPPKEEAEPVEKMTAEALGAVFAPLLLGDKLVPQEKEADTEYIARRTRDSAWIVQCLVGRWVEIVQEMRRRMEDVFVA